MPSPVANAGLSSTISAPGPPARVDRSPSEEGFLPGRICVAMITLVQSIGSFRSETSALSDWKGKEAKKPVGGQSRDFFERSGLFEEMRRAGNHNELLLRPDPHIVPPVTAR